MLKGLGWVCPAGAEATGAGVVLGGGGGGGGSWPPALWWGMSCCAPSEEPKRAGCLVDDSSGNHAFCSHRGGFNVMCRRGAPRVLPWGPASPGAKRDQARAQRGWGQCASLMAAGVRALDAAWGGPAMAKKSPRRESPCKPSLAFWGQGTGVGEILGCHFFFFPVANGYGSGGARGALFQLLCYALLSPSSLFQTLFPLTWRSGGHSNFWPKLKTAHKREERFGFGVNLGDYFFFFKRNRVESIWSEPRIGGILEPHF